ncbi:hypothetical protein NUITMVRE22_16420 [Enterococcus faecium]|nr:hypothetical protein NUITMVRE12_13110 [Enterococcus faecium]GMR98974.1 hypothetical protein NUITMVRE19_16140 [Enterococcus faecium]GMS04844.1 hypothetical protein NUITMVRE20_15760 [Enterococcus faecium]GMS07934.1 hypothetical protein NUITMVRE21_16720 [Enterococcus faecium]GMS10783.1 hypothetical protein NUITMVRE22_16420 [Enterococcus faecium]
MRKNLSFGKTSGKLSNRNNNSCKKLSYGKLREFDQGDNIDRIKRKRDRSHAELGKSAWRS